MVTMQNNRGGKNVQVDITVERDQGIFLSISGNLDGGGDEVFDVISTDTFEIEQFFTDVRDAEREYKRLQAGG